MAYQRMNSQYGNENSRPWLTEGFAERFRQAFGREMTAEERAFFGLKARKPETEEAEGAD
jgi:hypothetical protein